MSVLLFALAAWVRTGDFLEAQSERNAFLQRWHASVLEQMQRDESIQVENTRAVSPHSVLSVGLESILPFRFTSTKEGLRLGESRGARTIVDALFGTLDLGIVVTSFLSLLALALTFDSICGERSNGTLAIVLSYPVSRLKVLAAKVSAAFATLLICFTSGIAAALVVSAGLGAPRPDAVRWSCFGLASVLYLFVFSTLGVAISAFVRRPPESMLLSLLAWVVLVLVAPRVVGLTVAAAFPASQGVTTGIQEEEAVSRLRVAFTKRVYEAFYRLAEGPGDEALKQAEFAKARDAASDELQRRRRDALERFRSERDREEARRDRVTVRLSAISPAAVFSWISSEVAGTGMKQREHSIREIRAYDDTIGRKLSESRQVFFAFDASGKASRAMVTRADVSAALVPFNPTWAPLNALAGSLAFGSALLLAFGVVFLIVGYGCFARLDVRPL